MRRKPPRIGEIVAGAAGAVLLISLFLPWYREKSGACAGLPEADCPAATAAGPAWEAFAALDVFLLLTAIAGAGLLAVEVTQRTPAIPVAWSAMTALVALVATGWVLARTLNPPSADVEPLFALLGLGAAAGITIGCFLSMRDEGSGVRPRAGAAGGGPARGSAPEPLPVPTVGGEASHEGRR